MPPVSDSPEGIKAEIEKLGYLRAIDAHTLDLSMVPAERRRHLMTVGRRLTGQGLERREPQRRHPVLLTVVAQSAVDVLDDAVALFDQAISAREGTARRKLTNRLAERAKASEERLALLDEILPVLIDVGIPDDEVGGMLRGGLGLERLRGALATAQGRLPRDHGHLAMLAESYAHLRRFTPEVLAAVDFRGGTAAGPLLEAVAILKELNAKKARKVPDQAPDSFVPARWRPYLADAVVAGDQVALSALLGADGAALAARRAALGRRVGAGLAPLRRPGLLPVHPGGLGGAAAGVLPPGRALPGALRTPLLWRAASSLRRCLIWRRCWRRRRVQAMSGSM